MCGDDGANGEMMFQSPDVTHAPAIFCHSINARSSEQNKDL